MSNREIAYRLGKSPQTINNEIKRGTIQLKTKRKYSSKLAQANYRQHRERSKRPTKLTEELDHKISQAVKEKVSLEVVHQEIKNSVVCVHSVTGSHQVSFLCPTMNFSFLNIAK